MYKRPVIIILAVALLLSALACSKTEIETTRIGCVLSLTGLLGPKGTERLDAARLAVSEINTGGGVLSRQVELLEADDATDPDKCLARVKKMTEKDNVQVFIGGMSSDAVMATGPYLAEEQVVLVSPSATSGEISGQPWTHWFFRTAPHDTLQGIILADIIQQKGYMRLATVVLANSYGMGLEQAVVDALKKEGWTGEHTLSIYYEPDEKDFSAQLQNIKDNDPDVVLAVTYVEDGIVLFRQALEMGLDDIAWLGCDGNYSEYMFEDAQCAEFMARAIVAGTRSIGPSDDNYRAFTNAYSTAYGREPGIYCDTTYDAVHMVAKAIDKAGVYDGKAIKDALLVLGQKYHGASGIITFNEKGDRISGIFEVWKVEKDDTAPSGYKNVQIDHISIQ
jgi:ABC-type branched-subunit amino acid transport system substrate-binding protein